MSEWQPTPESWELSQLVGKAEKAPKLCHRAHNNSGNGGIGYIWERGWGQGCTQWGWLSSHPKSRQISLNRLFHIRGQGSFPFTARRKTGSWILEELGKQRFRNATASTARGKRRVNCYTPWWPALQVFNLAVPKATWPWSPSSRGKSVSLFRTSANTLPHPA